MITIREHESPRIVFTRVELDSSTPAINADDKTVNISFDYIQNSFNLR